MSELLKGTLDASENSDTLDLQANYGRDGIFTLYAIGTWNNAAIQVEVSPDGTNYVDLAGASLSADGAFNFSVKGNILRLAMSGGSGSEDVDFWIF